MEFDNLQRTIETFIGDYGTETLIQYLNDFERLSMKSNYKYIENVCESVIRCYKTNRKSLLDIKNRAPEVVDARRQVVNFIIFEKKLPSKLITTLFQCQLGTVYKYKREVKDRLENKHIYKEFTINYVLLKKTISNVSTRH